MMRTQVEAGEEMLVGTKTKRILLDPELYKAASKGDIQLFERIHHEQQSEAEIDVPNRTLHKDGRSSYISGVTYCGDTILHIATHFGHVEMARRICAENKHHLTTRNNMLETPLHYAAKTGNCKLVAIFIDLAKGEGSDVLQELLLRRNKDGETALYQAVLQSHVGIVEMLIDPNIHEVQFEDSIASIPNNKNISHVYLAIMQNSLMIANLLIRSLPNNVSRAAYVGPQGQTALHAANLRNTGIR